ncbi:PE family protein [Mycobacterium haemophilum]
MAFMAAVPEKLKTAADALGKAGARMAASSAAAGQMAASVVAPGGDEVSALVEAHLLRQAASYIEVSDAANTIWAGFVARVSRAADQYATTEIDNARGMG